RSPTRALSLSTSSSAAVLSRDFRPAWPAARNSSHHRESVAAVTPSSRESSSRASPRRRRRTASALRLEENRPRSFPDFCFPIGTPFRGHHAAVGCPRKSWCGGGDRPRKRIRIEDVDLFPPHTRGSTAVCWIPPRRHHVSPAYAGIDRARECDLERRDCFPRIRGDRPHLAMFTDRIEAFPPHTRGSTPFRAVLTLGSNVSPARSEEHTS